MKGLAGVYLGNAIKMCRTSLDLSQEELAKRTGLSASYVSLIEQGKRDPALSTVQSIAAALDVPLNLLMFLGAEAEELKGIPEDVREKLSGVVLKLLHARK
jgi:transcriptional regulator with XRE-family HTH domain